jgi:fibronectin-binding autotransporter adhesin
MQKLSRAGRSAGGRRRVAMVGLAVGSSLLGTISLASGTTRNWSAGSSNWNTSTNWTPVGVPAAGDFVNFVNIDGVARTLTLDVNTASLGSLTIDLTSDGTTSATNLLSDAAYNISANTETIGSAGNGAVLQSGGTNSMASLFLGQSGNGSGTYTLSNAAATLDVSGAAFIGGAGSGVAGGTGVLNLSAGECTFLGPIYIGNTGGSSGTILVGNIGFNNAGVNEYDGNNGSGSIVQLNGSNSPGNLYIANAVTSNSSYVLGGGGNLFLNSNCSVGVYGTATFNQSAGENSNFSYYTGTLSIGQMAGSHGTYSLSGTGYVNYTYMNIGDGGQGIFAMSGGAVSINNSEIIGNTTGQGMFVQSGGDNTVGDGADSNPYLEIAAGPASTGSYIMSGGTLTVDGNVYVGGSTTANGGSGAWTINGGAATVYGTVRVYGTTGSTINLSSGNLTVYSINASSASGLHWTGGTLQMSQGASTLPSVTIPATGTIGFQLNGATQGAGYSYLTGTGSAVLAGSLALGFGYTPATGTSFQLFKYPTVTGTFSSITDFPGDRWNISALDTTGTITLIAAPATVASVFTPPTAGTYRYNDESLYSNNPAIAAYPNNDAYTTFTATIIGPGATSTSIQLSSSATVSGLLLGGVNLVGTAPDGTTVQTSPVILTDLGTFTNGNASSLRLTQGAVLNLAGPSNFNTASSGFTVDGDTNAAVNASNGGVLTHNDTGTLTFVHPVVNVFGTLNVLQGTVVINNGGIQTGTMNVSAGASLTANGDFQSRSVVNDSGNLTFLGNGGTSLIPGIPEVLPGRQFSGTLNVAAGAVVNFNAGTGGGYFFDTSSHVAFAGTLLNVGPGAAVSFNDADALTIPAANLSGFTTFRTTSLTVGALNLNASAGTYSVRFETSTPGVGVTTLNQSGGTLLTGQDDGYAADPVNVATYNLSGGLVNGRVVVSTAMNWTGGTISGTYGDVVIEPSATLTISGNGGMTSQNGKFEVQGGNVNSSKPVTVGNSSSGVANYQQMSGSTTINSVFGVGNNGTETGNSPTASGVANISGGTFYASTILLGNSNGGTGTLTVSGTATVVVGGGIQVSTLNVNGGTLTVQNSTAPAGEDPVLAQSTVAGYMQNGTINVRGGVFSTPNLKLGPSSGFTGQYDQTGGFAVVTAGAVAGGGGNSGVGSITITGGSTALTSLTVGDTNGGTGSVYISGSGLLTVSGPTTVNNGSSVAIFSGGTIILTPHGEPYTQADTINGLVILGGTLNITNHAIDLPGADLPTIGALVASGYSDGAWNGTGIDSSAAANDTTHTTTVGVILNNDGDGNPIYTNPGLVMPPDKKRLGLFQGDNPQVNDVLIAYTYYGDANLDGKVDGSDYTLIDNGYAHHMTGFYNGDYNYDGVIDGSDYTLMDNAFNNQGASFGPSAQVATITSQVAPATVPEPAAVGLVSIAVAVLRRRRRGVNH